MLEFEVRNAERKNEQPHTIDDIELFSIERIKGSLTPKEREDRNGFCQVNGITLCPGDLLIVEGTIPRDMYVTIHKIHGVEFQDRSLFRDIDNTADLFEKAGIEPGQSSTWRLLLAWDGCDLGIFPGERERDCSKIKTILARK